ncbi:MAG: glycosyltransferase [Methanomicrobiales archaeon]|nr:glycosyltransferase [Methanomicrobiales archaeon]MDI6876759.1 glycosyltransferase [Methanomicrobiales archaeon]
MAVPSLVDYHGVVKDKVIADIYRKARTLYGSHIAMINSTYQGGGVAELISSLMPLINDIGIDAEWRLLHGNPNFFTVTKKIHNGLQGEAVTVSAAEKQLYLATNENFPSYAHLDHDAIIVHDPQPLPLIRYHRRTQPWIWQCHIDLTHPDEEIWKFIQGYVLLYDLMVVSDEKYLKEDLPVEQRIVTPAIDPLTVKNREIPHGAIQKYVESYGIPTDKPILTQISRFDKWKDPLGVLDIFEEVRTEIDCRLVLCGCMAADDPEGYGIYESVARKARDLAREGDIIFITCENNMLVNVLQRVSDVILQKSLREGFGLTVTEALWKGRPVVASNVGGIPLQITDGENGFLVDPTDTRTFADRIVQLMQDPAMANEMGRKGKETVREKFLITRMLGDYLDLLNYIMQ